MNEKPVVAGGGDVAKAAPRVVSITIGNPDGSVRVICDETMDPGPTKSQLEAMPPEERQKYRVETIELFGGFVESLTRSFTDTFAEIVEQLDRVARERGWVVEPATATASAFSWREGRRREARPREHCSGGGHTRRGPPADDDPHDQPLSGLVAAAGSDEEDSGTSLQRSLEAAYRLDSDGLAGHHQIIAIRLIWLARWDEEAA